MKKKLLIILIILLVIAFAGYFVLNNSSNNIIKVDSVNFNMPEGYHIDKNQSNNTDIAITNGSNVIHISSLDGKYATPFIKSYVNYSTTKGQIVSNSTLKINNILVYRFENSNASSIHEWFVYKNKVYTIYGWGNNPNFDGIAFELIESIK